MADDFRTCCDKDCLARPWQPPTVVITIAIVVAIAIVIVPTILANA